jgi:hypothetical protein
MPVTREQLLSHIHQPLQSTARPASPTKSTYRVRWRELSEWGDFTSDAQTYWSNLPAAERDAVLVGLAPNYWDFVGRQLSSLMQRVTREAHLLTPFSTLYAAPHNEAATGAFDNHALIISGVPDSILGAPDACFEFENEPCGVIELKNFWSLDEATVNEVVECILSPHDPIAYYCEFLIYRHSPIGR